MTTLLKKTKTWDERVARPLDISKSARALVILLPVLAATLAWSDHQLIQLAGERLGYLGAWPVHIAGGIVAIPVFLVARYIHHCRLYEEVIERVTHVELANGKKKAEIVEAELIVE